jgi:hypothetical protein
MYARLLAAFCLVHVGVGCLLGSSEDQSETPLVVYLSGSAQPQRSIEYMKLELGHLMRTAGYRVEWSDAHPSTDSVLIVVKLRGACEVNETGPAKPGSLASTAVTDDGRILPFSSIDCDSLTQLLASQLATQSRVRRDFLYGRAMARVLAHEIYHVLLETSNHSREGVARAGFTAGDLLSEHFEFEQSTLVKLRVHPGGRSNSGATEEAAGR